MGSEKGQNRDQDIAEPRSQQKSISECTEVEQD